MAGRNHRSYRERESLDRELDFEVSRKKDFLKDRFQDGGDRGRREADLDHSDKFVDRHLDVKDRGAMNGCPQSLSSTSNSSSGSVGVNRHRKGRPSGRSADREPGELSSGSGSDDPDAPQSKSRYNGVQDLENGTHSSPTKKRKFSPIVWDRDDSKPFTGITSRSKGSLTDVPLPPPPPLPEGFVPLNRVAVAKPVDSLSRMDNKVSMVSDAEQPQSNDPELGQMEEDEDYYPARNILSSRWADGNSAFEDDECEDVTEGILPSRKTNVPITEPLATRLHKKVLTPELGEVILREGSEGASSSSFDSSELGDEYQEIDGDKNDYMDLDVAVAHEDASKQESDADSEADSDLAKNPEPVQPPQRSINMLQGCRSVDEFERLNKIDEGTYGVVYRAKDKKTDEVVALKKVKMEKEREGFPLTSLREINILLSLHYPSIVDVKEVVVGNSLDSIFMVMEYMEHDLKALMETMKQPYSQSEVKCLMLQLLAGVKYLHDNWVLHRDLKTSNLLLNNRGELKICDFGLSRQYGSPLKPYTHLVVTLWYRAPELLLGAKEYSTAIDMWSLGCIMAELLAKEPLFSGKTEFDQLDKIFRILGTPNEKIWPGFAKLPGVKVNFVRQPYNRLREKFPPTSFSGRPTLSEAGFDLLNKLLTYDPDKRITAEDALNHEWFREVPLPKSKEFMPTFPAQHAQDRRLRRIMKSPDPLEEQRRRELQQGEVGTGSLFC
uniref:Cyclin-dependent kinase G-2 n=1 Tax=Anthurium amnicola TaxID=1678845 RepID=A0A1D1YIG7_9ARAE